MSRRDDRRLDFKFQGLTNDELRRRREETTIELRKTRRDDLLSKRRNLNEATAESPNVSLEDEPRAATTTRIGEKYKEPLYSNDSHAIFDACQGFRKILSKERHPPIQQVIELGVVDRLVELLSSKGIPPETPIELAEKIIFEAAWALTNIASGATEQTLTVVHANAVPIFIDLLTSLNKEIREQAIWALGNISGDGPQLRDYVLQCNAMSNLLSVIYEEASLPNPNLPLLRNAVWTVSNLCRGKPFPSWNQVAVALPILTELLSSNDQEILIDACWAFSYLTDGADHNMTEIVKCGAVAKLVTLLQHNNHAIQAPALRSIGNVVTGDDNTTQLVLNMGVLVPLKNLLASTRQNIKKEACWAISNITAGTLEQIKMVYDQNIFPILTELVAKGDPKTRREACWALCNATSFYATSPELIKYFVSEGIIPALRSILEELDPKVLKVALDGIENILKAGEQEALRTENGMNPYAVIFEEERGADALWDLQSHDDNEVYLKAKHLVDCFFSEQDGELKVDLNASNQEFSF